MRLLLKSQYCPFGLHRALSSSLLGKEKNTMWGTGQILIGQSASVIQRYIRYIPLALVAFLAVIVQSPVPTEAASLAGIVRGTAYAGFLEVPAGSSLAS